VQRIQDLGPLLGLVLLCIAGWALNPDFATADNVLNVLTRTAFIGIIAVGMTFVIISGGIDLSVGSMAALIAGAMILLMNGISTSISRLISSSPSASSSRYCSARCSDWRMAS
jgi:ribose transport system permease protein